MRWLTFVILAGITLVLQTGLAPHLSIYGVRPDWMFVEKKSGQDVPIPDHDDYGALSSIVVYGQASVPVDSFRFPYGCVVDLTGLPWSPTARLCPVPTIPTQSQAAPTSPSPDPPASSPAAPRSGSSTASSAPPGGSRRARGPS